MTEESRPENNVDTPGIDPGSTDYNPKVIPIIPRAETRIQTATCVITRCNIYEVQLAHMIATFYLWVYMLQDPKFRLTDPKFRGKLES